jgi:tetratricopeptide (TPR) repeat protein
LQLLTQLARAQGLQGNLAAAQATLDAVRADLSDATPVAHVRYLLEQGRVVNSGGDPAESATSFQQAWDRALAHSQTAFAIDAAHMLGIVAPAAERLGWNLRALQLAGAATDARSQRWRGSLHNNIGWYYHDAGDYATALTHFELAVLAREAQHQPRETRIAKWCVGRALRSLQRYDAALAMQQTLMAEWATSGEEPDGYIAEEIGECLLALGRSDASYPYFAQAYDRLARDDYLTQHEPERLARLQRLGAGA